MSDYILNKDYFLGVIDDLIVLAEEKRIIFRNWTHAIGDGDHGMNMKIGFREGQQNLDGWKDEDINTLFKNAGTALW